MTSKFKVIGVIGQHRTPGVVETLKALIQFLQEFKTGICVDEETAAILTDVSLTVISRKALSKQCDLLIVVGGDGSMLHAAHSIVNGNTLVIGINRGRLGFLTDIHPLQLYKLKAILEGDFILEKRFLLQAQITLPREGDESSIHSKGRILGENIALNEVALIPDSVPHMTEFEIYIDDQFVCSQNSDGVIVATPTGSTAYALSGGGPILHPQLDAIVIVPMFPHSLNLRPIVIEGQHRITLLISLNNTTRPRLTCDSQDAVSVPPGSLITITKKKEHLHLIHPVDYDYYETLRSKLHWGHKLLHSE